MKPAIKFFAVAIPLFALGACQSSPQQEAAPLPIDVSGESPISEVGLSQQAAIQLAIDHLESLGIVGATLDRAELELENGTQVWDIDFIVGGAEYEFYIDSETGEMLRAPGETSSSAIPSGAGPGIAPANWPENAITPESAIEIAQGIAPGNLVAVDHDFENGMAVWHVEIISGGATHEVSINALTGELVEHEMED